MKRDPSLHISLSDLTKVLQETNINNKVGKAQAEFLLMICKPYSISTRTVEVKNKFIEDKVKKLLNSTRLDSDQFSKLIYTVRQRLRHRGITLIRPSSREWPYLKEVTNLALGFCSEFNLPVRKGCIEYITIGISKMNKFNVAKFVNLHESICETFLAIKEIEKDSDSELTDTLYKIYSEKILHQTGIFEDFKSEPEKYVAFVRAREQAKNLNVSLEIYIEAQFDALGFANGIPYPSQMYGTKATERLYKYLYKEGLKIDSNRIK